MQGVIGIEDVNRQVLYQIGDYGSIDHLFKRYVGKTILGTVKIQTDIVCLKVVLYPRKRRFTGLVIAADLKFAQVSHTVYAAVLRDYCAVRAYHLAQKSHSADRVAACQYHGYAVIDKSPYYSDGFQINAARDIGKSAVNVAYKRTR